MDIAVLDIMDGSLRQRILREPNLTLEQAMALEQYTE